MSGHRFVDTRLRAQVAPPASQPDSADKAKADAVMRVVRDGMAQAHLKAVIVRVTVDGKEVVTQALGESMTGVPATTAMHFRNGAVAISYVSTLLLELVDEKKVSLDDKLSKWLPEIPHAERVTLGQLAQMTSGYVDYVIGNTAMNDALYANPFRRWTEPEHPRATPISQAAALRSRNQLELRAHQLRPARAGAGEGHRPGDVGAVVRQGAWSSRPDRYGELDTPEIPPPVLHAFSSERRRASRSRPAHRSTRSRRTGTRPGPSPTAPSRPPTSTTWKPPRSASDRASC